MTDRLFLAELVHEIGPALRGSRVRQVRVDPSGPSVSLFLSLPAPSVLCFHLGPGAPGLYRCVREKEHGKLTPRESKLTKWLGSAGLVSVAISELDRVVTVRLEHTRLSGRKKSIELVFEITGTRVSLFVVDRQTDNIIDCFSRGGTRLAPGERFIELAPPPQASLPARDLEELERRLAETREENKGALLFATGWTPLLVKELSYLIEKGENLRSAFENIRERLREPRAALYVARGSSPKKGRIALLSPIPLDSVHDRDERPVASFDDAMSEAVQLSVRAERARALRQRLESALTRRLKRGKALSAKLREQKRTLVEPEVLRKKGETLLAGIASAERVSDSLVRVPDPFDPDGATVELLIDPRLDLATNAERLFRRSRKAERTRVELSKRLESVRRELDHVEGMALDLAEAAGLEELESLEREAEEQGLVIERREPSRVRRRPEKLPPREFVTSGGFVVLVGRSARSNEDVTFRVASSDDLWFHAAGTPGSHVVLKVGSSAPGEEDILRAASLAARFSKSRHDSRVEVMMTERRNVSKIKGAPPGLVKVEKFKTLRVRPAAELDVR